MTNSYVHSFHDFHSGNDRHLSMKSDRFSWVNYSNSMWGSDRILFAWNVLDTIWKVTSVMLDFDIVFAIFSIQRL